jgi:hypothetical protein
LHNTAVTHTEHVDVRVQTVDYPKSSTESRSAQSAAAAPTPATGSSGVSKQLNKRLGSMALGTQGEVLESPLKKTRIELSNTQVNNLMGD